MSRTLTPERAAEIGRLGGHARARSTTPEQRREWARRGAEATHRARRIARLEAEIAERLAELAALQR